MAPGDINQALERALVLARNELKYVAAVEKELGALPPIDCHIGSLHQVFLNLLVNAAHAIEDKQAKHPDGKRGGIKVATRTEREAVIISIQDSGCGIPTELRERIFEPFFTTKPVGKGSGQGLPLVRAVVEKHHGKIEIDSEVGVGTTFTLRLPTGQRKAA
jgi:signal transduction histidine kinase